RANPALPAARLRPGTWPRRAPPPGGGRRTPRRGGPSDVLHARARRSGWRAARRRAAAPAAVAAGIRGCRRSSPPPAAVAAGRRRSRCLAARYVGGTGSPVRGRGRRKTVATTTGAGRSRRPPLPREAVRRHWSRRPSVLPAECAVFATRCVLPALAAAQAVAAVDRHVGIDPSADPRIVFPVQAVAVPAPPTQPVALQQRIAGKRGRI